MIASSQAWQDTHQVIFPTSETGHLEGFILYIRQSPIIGRRLTMELNWPLQQRPCHFSVGPRPRVRRTAPTVGVINQFVALRATDRW